MKGSLDDRHAWRLGGIALLACTGAFFLGYFGRILTGAPVTASRVETSREQSESVTFKSDEHGGHSDSHRK
jgi:hypothetical protein